MTREPNSRSRRDFLTTAAGASGVAAIAASLGHSVPAAAQRVDVDAMGPTPEQIAAFRALPQDRPVVMVNLLKFKPGGEAEYQKYGAGIGPILAKRGARMLFSGRTLTCLIGRGDWDMVALVEYPSPASLLEMAASEEYQAIHHHREAGLAGQVNYAVSAGGSG